MADKMMRIAGRDENGLAKAVSVLTDPNGKGVLRVFDAAPHNQDAEADAKRVIGVARSEIQTIFEGSVAPGETKQIFVQCNFETELWVHVYTNQQPWTLHGGSLEMQKGYALKPFYPDLSASQITTHNLTHPKSAFWIGQNHNTSIPVPTSMSDAKAWSLPPASAQLEFRYTNSAAIAATVTINVVRVWR